MTARLTNEDVKNYFKERGCTLLSEYVNSSSKLKYICANGHEAEIVFSSFQRGQRCAKCSGNKKHTIEHVRDYFKEKGCELLTKKYINNRGKLEYICANGHRVETTFDSFQRGNGCMKCYRLKRTHSPEYVKNYFEELGCKLLSKEYKNAGVKLKYICKNGHETEAKFNSIRSGHGCKKCLNKTEKIVLDFLQEHHKNVLSEAKFEWCKNKQCLPFDFLLEEQKVLVEVDGRQHFKEMSHWKNDIQNRQERDVYKMTCAIEQGYRIVRIFQEDVFYNNINWKIQLQEAITSNEQVVYISKDPELYKNMRQLLLL